jgi:hypothetical protein
MTHFPPTVNVIEEVGSQKHHYQCDQSNNFAKKAKKIFSTKPKTQKGI